MFYLPFEHDAGEAFNSEHCFDLNKETKHKLAGTKPPTCIKT